MFDRLDPAQKKEFLLSLCRNFAPWRGAFEILFPDSTRRGRWNRFRDQTLMPAISPFGEEIAVYYSDRAILRDDPDTIFWPGNQETEETLNRFDPLLFEAEKILSGELYGSLRSRPSDRHLYYTALRLDASGLLRTAHLPATSCLAARAALFHALRNKFRLEKLFGGEMVVPAICLQGGLTGFGVPVPPPPCDISGWRLEYGPTSPGAEYHIDFYVNPPPGTLPTLAALARFDKQGRTEVFLTRRAEPPNKRPQS